MYSIDLDIFRREYLELEKIALSLHREVLILDGILGDSSREEYEELLHSEEKLRYILRCMNFAEQEYSKREEENRSFVETIYI